MKRFAAGLLTLALLLTLSAVPAAATGAGDGAIGAYMEIVQRAETYDYGAYLDAYSDNDIKGYSYALVDLTEGNGVPTLLLSVTIENAMFGYRTYTRVFQYEPERGTVRAPEDSILSGISYASGLRGVVALVGSRLAFVEMMTWDGKTTLYGVGISGDVFRYDSLWSGTGAMPEQYSARMTQITWTDAGDLSAFAPYRAAGPLSTVAYYGDRGACAMSADMARAYAAAIDAAPGPAVRAALIDAGGGQPLLWLTWGDGVYDDDSYTTYQFGPCALTGSFGSQVYGFDNGLVEYPRMTELLRAGENGVIAYSEIPYYSEFGEEFSLYRLSGGAIRFPAFATGFEGPFVDATLNGRNVGQVSSLMEVFRMADPDVRVLLQAEQGLSDMLCLTGVWSTGAATRGALLAWAEGKTPSAPKNLAYASTQTVSVDGRSIEFQCYALKDARGNPTNYIKLRDLAILLNGTDAQFDVRWDGNVNILTRTPYAPNGSELRTPFSGDREYRNTDAVTWIDGRTVELAAFMLTDDAGGGYTYYKLRDLGRCLGFNVGWSAERGIFVETDKPYDPTN